MSQHYYNLCRANIGRVVCIRSTCGKVYKGVICSVNGQAVGIRPLGRKVEGQDESINASTSIGTEQAEADQILWFGGLFWIPLLAIASLAFLW